MDTDSSNIWQKIFWRIVTVFHYTPVNAKQFDGLNIDSLAGSVKNVKISPVKILRYMVWQNFCVVKLLHLGWKLLFVG